MQNKHKTVFVFAVLFTQAYQGPTVPKLFMKNQGTTYVIGYDAGAWEKLRCWLVLCHLEGVSENEELPGCAAAPQVSLNTLGEPKANSVTCVFVICSTLWAYN